MDPADIGDFIPLAFLLIIVLVIICNVYFNIREKQILEEKVLAAQSVKEFLENKKDLYSLMKIGIISIAFGISLGLGMALQDYTDRDYWVPFALFTINGLGFVAANIIAVKLESQNKKEVHS